jgi:hypothetical protein
MAKPTKQDLISNLKTGGLKKKISNPMLKTLGAIL